MTRFDWQLEQGRQVMAGKQADAIVQRLGLPAPIDPLKIVESEYPLLVAGGADFKNKFDGKLKYRPDRKRFVLFYNTKYDVGFEPGRHHPRTRFSIGHELGHYFIETHQRYLRSGGKAHASRSEFRRNDKRIEREADAFAASLLLPTHRLKPTVDKGELTIEMVDKLSRDYQTSSVCTTIRAVQLSGDPCAVAGIRDGQIAWMFPSERLIEGGCYPKKGMLGSSHAVKRWTAFDAGDTSRVTEDGLARHWFQLFGRAANHKALYVTESYLPAKIMKTLMVLLTLDDNHLFDSDD